VLSVYFNLDPSEFATPAARATEVNSVVTEAGRRAEEAGGLEHEERQALRADVERVREVLEGPDVAADGTRGLAVFACGVADVLEVVRLPHPIESRVEVEDHPVVEPLVRAETRDRWCVVLVNRRTARIFCGAADGLQETDRIEDDVHQQHEQGGWSQARYERSVEQEKLNHLIRAADTLFARFKRRPFDHVLVGAPQELAGEVEERLHPYVRERLAGRVSVDVEGAGVDEVQAAAREAVEQHVATVEREALDRLATGLGRGERAAAGIEAVMEALEQARVELLLVAEDFDAPELEDAIEKAIASAAEVLVVRHHDDLAQHGGVAAVLRF
jgi:peptide subunit release factor 1 (eRF1)